MDAILTEKAPVQRMSLGPKEHSYYAQPEPLVSPSNRYGLGANQLSIRNITSARAQRTSAQLAPLHVPVNNIETPKRASNAHAVINTSANPSINTEDIHSKPVKHQPKISNNPHLPSVFSNEKPHSIKIKTLVRKQKLDKYGDLSLDQENPSPDSANNLIPNAVADRNSRAFMSPQRVMNSNMSAPNMYLVNKMYSNTPPNQAEALTRPSKTRESARRLQFENLPALKAGENSIDAGNNNQNGGVSCAKKQIVIFKKFLSKSPENKIPIMENPHANFSNAMKFFDQFASPVSKMKMKVNLSEMITLKKIKSNQNGGVTKRMLHVPTLNIYDIQEEPIKASENLKDWVSKWKKFFNKKDNKSLQKIYTCFWNAPEGCVSILKECSRKGSLQELLDHHICIPENCIQQITINILKGLSEVHSLMRQTHGALLPSEIVFDSNCQPKLSPGITFQSTNGKFGGSQAISIITKGSDKEEGSSKLLAFNNRMSSIEELPKSSINSHNSLIQNSQPLSSDIFDLGYLLLTCALGNLDFFDISGFYSLENLKSLIEAVPQHRRQLRSPCCLLHNEEELRRIHSELPTTKFGNSGQKPPLTNNFHIRSPRTPDSNGLSNKKVSMPFTLLDLLHRNNRYSDSFIDFLCHCLRIDPAARLETKGLIDHEFVSQSHVSLGPLMNLSELISTNRKEQTFEMSNKLNEEHLSRVCEAVKIVLLNPEVKDRIMLFANGNIYEKPNSREYRKISDLATELGVPIHKALEKFRNEIFTDELSH